MYYRSLSDNGVIRLAMAFAVACGCLGVPTIAAQQVKPKPGPEASSAQQKPSKEPTTKGASDQAKDPSVEGSKPGTPQRIRLEDRPNATLADVNVDVSVDRRVIVTMAALNIAGYDYESGTRQLSALRKQIREDLKNTNPALVDKLKTHFQAHRAGKTDVVAVAPYLTLALALTDPPAFTLDVPIERLPEDVREMVDFGLLLQEFYQSTGFARIMPKYLAEYTEAAKSYGPAAVYAVSAVIQYLHTEPVLELPPLYNIPRTRSKDAKPRAKDEEEFVAPNRIRRFIIMPDLLNATGAANLRTVRDTYYLLLGPTSEPNIEAIRRGFLSFVIDPLTERAVKEVAAIRAELRKLLDSRGDKADPDYKSRSAYYLITDSLVRATDARMTVVGLPGRRNYGEMDAIFDLSSAYERGAVLVFHFYEKMSAFDQVGINLKDYFPDLVQRIDFEREAVRLEEYAQRLARHKQAKLEATSAPVPPPTISNSDEQTVGRLLEADQLIKARRYDDARTILEGVRRERPNNARALFGLADVTSKKATLIADTDRLGEQLYAAVELYKQAAENASMETEKWLAQRSYVAAGKILEFLGDEDDAAAAIELALKLGETADKAAYQEAVKAKQQREQKTKP